MWSLPSDLMQDLQQERALALLEGRDPKAAARAFINRERRFYDMIVPEFHLEHEERFAIAPMVIIRPIRSDESVEQRKEYTRNWWRVNGREYRRRRAEQVTAARLAQATQQT